MNNANTNTAKFNLRESEEICIIDDSPMHRFITQKICERTLPAIPLKVFEDIDTALAYLNISIVTKRTIFLDLDMPEKNGWQFLDIYFPKPSDMIYILSTSDETHDFARAKTYPIVRDFLIKPLTPSKIEELKAMAV